MQLALQLPVGKGACWFATASRMAGSQPYYAESESKTPKDACSLVTASTTTGSQPCDVLSLTGTA